MKRFFCKTNGANYVLFVDEKGMAYCVDESCFDDFLTLEVAKKEDYSNFDNCETAIECAIAIGAENSFNNVIVFNEEKYEYIQEF